MGNSSHGQNFDRAVYSDVPSSSTTTESPTAAPAPAALLRGPIRLDSLGGPILRAAQSLHSARQSTATPLSSPSGHLAIRPFLSHRRQHGSSSIVLVEQEYQQDVPQTHSSGSSSLRIGLPPRQHIPADVSFRSGLARGNVRACHVWRLGTDRRRRRSRQVQLTTRPQRLCHSDSPKHPTAAIQLHDRRGRTST